MIYFSDKYENIEFISTNVWNGIVSLYNELIATNKFARAFPEVCSDNGLPYAVNVHNLENAIKAEIPSVKLPLQSIKEIMSSSWFDGEAEKDKILLSTLFDLVEFMFKHLSNPQIIGKFHEFMNHHHLTFSDDLQQIQNAFVDKINTIFRRNNLSYVLSANGVVERIVDESINPLILKESFYTKDESLNKLLNKAFKKFKSSKEEDRREALDNLWDGYEQLKTHYGANKKVQQSIETFIDSVSLGNDELKKAINEDASMLYGIGNTLDIRHKNTEVEKLTHSFHVDYLFFRMSNLIHLLLQHFDLLNEATNETAN